MTRGGGADLAARMSIQPAVSELAVVVDGLSAYAPAASPPAEPPASAAVLCPGNGSNGTPAEPWEKQRQSRKLHTSATEGL